MGGLAPGSVGLTGAGRASAAPATPLPQASPPTKPAGLVGFAFGAKDKDVTLFDPASHKPVATQPLGVTVRWLSNQQRFWDGRHVWTYDFPDNRVVALAIDPIAVAVARTLATGGAGPAHSLMLTPDRATAWVNLAGDDALAVLDLASGRVVDRVRAGKFP